MIRREILLREVYPALEGNADVPRLSIFAHQNSSEIEIDRSYPAVLIMPGGGYAFVSEREGVPVAEQFYIRGFNAFVLTYSVAPARYPSQLLQAAAAIDYIKNTAVATNTDTDNIFVCGFSAGGHLAGSIGCLWNEQVITDTLGGEPQRYRPKGMALCYAVITSGMHTHGGSFNNLCGEDEQLKKRLSLETRVTPETSPAFIWHTANDGTVPVENAFMMAKALKSAGVEYEMHVFKKGRHGLSVCTRESAGENKEMINPSCEPWLAMCAEFFCSL